MSSIKESVDIARPPEDVYSYVTEPPSTSPSGRKAPYPSSRSATPRWASGSRMVVTRRVGRRTLPMTMEVTEFDPPAAGTSTVLRARQGRRPRHDPPRRRRPVTPDALRPRLRGPRDGQAAGATGRASAGTEGDAEERAEAQGPARKRSRVGPHGHPRTQGHDKGGGPDGPAPSRASHLADALSDQ